MEDSIYDEFVERSAKRAKSRVVGDPFESNVEQGPQIDSEQASKIMSMIEEGQGQGAKLVSGGTRVGDKGYYVAPTVFANVTDDMTIAREEVANMMCPDHFPCNEITNCIIKFLMLQIFGPVQQILKFSSLNEVITRANLTDYGLAAAVFTKDIEKANYVIQGLRAGTVWYVTYKIIF